MEVRFEEQLLAICVSDIRVSAGMGGGGGGSLCDIWLGGRVCLYGVYLFPMSLLVV